MKFEGKPKKKLAHLQTHEHTWTSNEQDCVKAMSKLRWLDKKKMENNINEQVLC